MQLKCGKVFVENKPRGESINKIGKTEGVVLLTEFHLIGSNPRNLTRNTKQARQSPDL